jgi:hypothetical protein
MKRASFWLFLIGVAAAGFVIGRLSGNVALPEADTRTEFPALPAPPKTDGYQTISAAQQEKDLIIEVPVEGAEVTGEFLDVAGRAKVGRQSVVLITVKSADGAVLASTEAKLGAEEVGSYGRFGATIPLSEHQFGKAEVELTLKTADGTAATETRSFVFAEPNTVPVKVFFGQKVGDYSESCDIVHPVDRMASSKVAIYRAVIQELLKGPTLSEKNAGYFTSIPSGVALKSIAADAQGVVTADFTKALDQGVAGSCDVIISINGRIDDILQP